MFSGLRHRAAGAAHQPLPLTALRPGDFGYDAAREDTNARLDFKPAVIVYCYTTGDVSRCVTWAVENQQKIAIRSGGHDYEGFSLNNDGIVIDLSRYRGVDVSKRKKTAWVRAGTDLETLYHELAAVRLTVPGGTCPSVAVAGIVTGGGYGMLVRRYGLLADHLRRVRLVDAEGRVRDSNRDPMGRDILWASRGGGGGSSASSPTSSSISFGFPLTF